MNSPRKFAGILLASSGLALAVSLIAQSNPSASSPGAAVNSPAAGNKTPLPNPPAKPNTPPHDPTVSAVPAIPAEPKPGSGMTPGAANSGSGVGGRETVAPTPTPVADAAKARDGAPVANAPGAHWFSTLDTDRDGRISPTEFSSPSASWLRDGPAGAGVNNDSTTGKASPPLATPGARDVTDRPMPAGNSGPLSGPNSSANNAQLFQQVDTNHDGYLSSAELEAYRAPTPLER